jgi:hypothetical protein
MIVEWADDKRLMFAGQVFLGLAVAALGLSVAATGWAIARRWL